MPALAIQVVTGLGLAYRLLGSPTHWFAANPLAHLVQWKLLCLAGTAGLAFHAKTRVIPRLRDDNLAVMAASGSRSRTRRTAPRRPDRRGAPSCRRSRTRRRRCAGRARAPAGSRRSLRRLHEPPRRDDRRARAVPRTPGLRRARCRRGSARGSRPRLIRTRDGRHRRTSGRSVGTPCSRATATSHAKSRRPGRPSSAATVTGVVCDAAAFGSLPRRCARSLYARRNPPTPTPITGWWIATLTPFETSVERPLVTCDRDARWRTAGETTIAAITTTIPATTRSRPARRQATTPPTTIAAIRARKLDCENDGSSPAHVIPSVSDDRDSPQRVAASEQHDDEARDDRDHEEAPVDRRVVEDRVDAVEPPTRRVRVVDLHLRVPEDVARLVLDDPDHREHERHHCELDVAA